MFSCEFYEIFKNTYFYRPPPVSASGVSVLQLIHKFLLRKYYKYYRYNMYGKWKYEFDFNWVSLEAFSEPCHASKMGFLRK